MKDSAAACCAACREQRATASETGCNVWVFCAAEGGCGDRERGECWLKNQPEPNAPHINMLGIDKRTKTGLVEWQAGGVVKKGSTVRTDVKSARAGW